MQPIAIATLLAVAAAALPAAAQPDRWAVRGRGFALIADDDSDTVGGTGTRVAVSDSSGFELAVSYAPFPNWAFELAAATAPIDLTSVGGQVPDIDVGSADLLVATFAMQYRFATAGRVDPYLGIGVGFGRLTGFAPAADLVANQIADIAFSETVRVYTQAGVEVEVGKGWLLSADVRYLPMTTEAEFVSTTGALFDEVAIELNPILLGIGIGRRF